MNKLNEQLNRTKELMGILKEQNMKEAHISVSCMDKIIDKKDYHIVRSLTSAGHYGGGDAGKDGIGACGRHLYELMTDKKYATNAPTYDEILEYGKHRDYKACDRADVGYSDMKRVILDNWGCWVICMAEAPYTSDWELTDFTKREDGEDKCNPQKAKEEVSAKEDAPEVEEGCTCGFSTFIFSEIKQNTPECSKACVDYEEQLKADGKWNDNWIKDAGVRNLRIYQKNNGQDIHGQVTAT